MIKATSPTSVIAEQLLKNALLAGAGFFFSNFCDGISEQTGARSLASWSFREGSSDQAKFDLTNRSNLQRCRMKPIQNPVTGREAQNDLSRPEQALAQFYCAFNQRDLDLMKLNWIDSDEAEMDNPLGGIKRGWREIESVYRSVFEGAARVAVEFFDYTIHVSEEFFYVVGRERGELRAGDGAHLELKIRTSRLFRRINGSWRQVHHHGSIDDPELLQKYQQLVLGKLTK